MTRHPWCLDGVPRLSVPVVEGVQQIGGGREPSEPPGGAHRTSDGTPDGPGLARETRRLIR